MVLNYVLVGCLWPVCPCKWMANNPWVSTYWICLPSLVCRRADVSYFLRCTRATKEIGDVCTQAKSCLHISNFWLTQLVQRRAIKLIIKDRPYGERLQEPNLLSLASRRLFMDSAFLFKCMMGLHDLDLCLIILWQLTIITIISDMLITNLRQELMF